MAIKKRQWFRLGLGSLFSAGAVLAFHLMTLAATTSKAPVMNARAKRGAAIFQQNCVACHNKQPDDTTPFGPPNLHGMFGPKSALHPPLTPEQTIAFIKKGAAPMPAFGNVLSDTQLSDVIAYLKVQ